MLARFSVSLSQLAILAFEMVVTRPIFLVIKSLSLCSSMSLVLVAKHSLLRATSQRHSFSDHLSVIAGPQG